jgi:hypothetical protein
MALLQGCGEEGGHQAPAVNVWCVVVGRGELSPRVVSGGGGGFEGCGFEGDIKRLQ